jgi:hypothetical protein
MGMMFSHSGAIFIFFVSGWYKNIPFRWRNLDSSISLFVAVLVLFDISSMLCHSPSFSDSNSSSICKLIVILYSLFSI